ncbi:MAG: hypothetical protein K2J20_00330, partial [Bacilli bacterium]|nr:hypothetical protein [Bacilli bacterium]
EYNMYLHYLLDNYIPNFKNIKLGYEGKKAELAKQLIDIYVNRAISVNDEGEISIQDEQAFVKLGDMSAGNDTGYTVLASKLGLANESLVSIYASFLQSCYNLGNADAAQAKNILRELYSNFELGCFSFTANQLAPVINRIRKYADEIMARADAKEYENIRELVAKLLDSIDRRLAFEEKR